MASFQVKIGWKMMRKRENEKLSFRFVPTRRVIKNSKKTTKKFKKTILASSHVKIGWKIIRKRENKNYSSVPFLPDA